MRTGVKALIVALFLAILPTRNLPAQPIALDPPPILELQEVAVIGPDLLVRFDWSPDGAPPPALAWLRLVDSQGQTAATVGVSPLYGSQSVWIPGGANPRPGDVSTGGPMNRQLTLLSHETREVLLESGLSITAGGPVTILGGPIPGLIYSGRQCFLHVVNVTVDDPEDGDGDEPYLVIQGMGLWRGPSGVRGVRTLPINFVSLLCDTCQNIRKSTTLDLYDEDGPFDPNDHLGSKGVSGCSTIPLQTIKMSGWNYTYWLRYRVACFEDLCQ